MEKGIVVNEYKNGTVKKFVTATGYQFEAFIPNNCNVDTSIIMYEHGDYGYYNDWKSYTNKFSSGDCNSIIIRADRNNSIDLYNHIVKQYNLTENQRMTVSFSGGTVYALQETAQMIKQNPTASPPVAFIMDGYVPTTHLENVGVINAFKESNALVLAFGQSNNSNSYVENYKNLAKTGVNVVILRDKTEYGNSHKGMNTSFMEGGLLEFALGEKELPNRYDIMIYDEISGNFKNINYSEVSNIDLIYNYFNIDNCSSYYKALSNTLYYEFSSDSSVIQNYLNDIISAIRKTEYLNFKVPNSGGASTTKVPSEIPSVVRKYFSESTRTLNSIVSLTNEIAKIEPSYKRVDKDLSNSIGENIFNNLIDSVVNAVDEIDDVFFD